MSYPASVSSDWVKPLTGDGASPVAMVCFPSAGGGVIGYSPWVKPLRPRADLHAASLPGREYRLREDPVSTLDDLVAPLTRSVAELANRPLLVFGHSFGALLAYEVVQRLCDQELVDPKAVHLVVSGRVAPHLVSRTPRLSHLSLREIVFQVADLHGGIPLAILEQPDYVAMIGRVLQSDLHVNEQYAWSERPPLPCSVTAVGGMSDPVVSRSELDAWGQHTHSEFNSRMLDGDHFYFRSPTGQQELLGIIEQCCLSLAVSTGGSGAALS